MSFTIEQAARLYCVRYTEYETTPMCRAKRVNGREGLLVSSGAGMMMGIMDQTWLRYCVEYDTASRQPCFNIESFVEMAARNRTVAICGWFSLTKYAVLRGALKSAVKGGSRRVIAYAGANTLAFADIPGVVSCHSLADFLATINVLQSA